MPGEPWLRPMARSTALRLKSDAARLRPEDAIRTMVLLALFRRQVFLRWSRTADPWPDVMALINFIWQYGGALLATLVCGWSMVRGGPTERFAAVVLLVSWYLTLILQTHRQADPGIWVKLIDLTVFILFAAMSLKTRKLWTLFIAALQLDTVVGNLAAQLAGFGQYPAAVAAGLWGGYGLLIALAAGTISHQLSERRRWKTDARP